MFIPDCLAFCYDYELLFEKGFNLGNIRNRIMTFNSNGKVILAVVLPQYNSEKFTITSEFDIISTSAFALYTKIKNLIVDYAPENIENGLKFTNIPKLTFSSNVDVNRMSNGIGGLNATEIEFYAQFVEYPPNFSKYMLKLETVKLGNAIKVICEYSFAGCIKLKNINLENILFINEFSFQNCSSLNPVFSDNLMRIDEGAFQRTNITKLKFPEKLRYLGYLAFSYCENLKEIESNYLTTGFEVPYDGVEKITIKNMPPAERFYFYHWGYDNIEYIFPPDIAEAEEYEIVDKFIIHKVSKTIVKAFPSPAKPIKIPDGVLGIERDCFTGVISLLKVPNSFLFLKENKYWWRHNIKKICYYPSEPKPKFYGYGQCPENESNYLDDENATQDQNQNQNVNSESPGLSKTEIALIVVCVLVAIALITCVSLLLMKLYPNIFNCNRKQNDEIQEDHIDETANL